MEALLLGALVLAGVMVERTMDHDWFRALIQLAALLGAVLATLFVGYFRRNPWRKRAISRALMTSQATIALALWWTAVALSTPRFEGKDTAWLVVLLLVAYSMGRLFFTLRKNQRRATEEQQADRRITDLQGS